MKSLFLGSLTAITLAVGAAATPSSANPPAAGSSATPNAAAAPASSASNDAFIVEQAPGTMRAPKLVGVAVYDSNNKSVGKIDDLLLDHSGEVKTVVIGVGGFLGIGSKDVGVPYSAIHWETRRRKVATSAPAPASAPGQPAPTGEKPNTKTLSPAATEAYQGYPDKAVLDMTQAQLKNAPEFKYAENPATKMSDNGTAPASSQKP